MRPISNANQQPRNPRVHRPSGLPSVSKHSLDIDGGSTTASSSASTTKKVATSLKKSAYHVLAIKPHHHPPPTPDTQLLHPPDHHGRLRSASTPNSPTSHNDGLTQAQIDIEHDRIAQQLRLRASNSRGSGNDLQYSPPIVDFTRFEDKYRGPTRGEFGLGAVERTGQGGSRVRMRSSTETGRDVSRPGVRRRDGGRGFGAGGSRFVEAGASSDGRVDQGLKPALKKRAKNNNLGYEDLPNSTLRLQRKSNVGLIVSSLEDVLGDDVDVKAHLDVDRIEKLLLRYKAGSGVSGRSSKHPRTKVRRPVLGEPLLKTAGYASATMLLGGRELALPTVVVHCVEELYRTGIYQSNFFRTLPNRARLLELISIFDSEVQPQGSIIRSPQSAKSQPSADTNPCTHSYNGSVEEGYGSATSLHLESTPDICALLTSYLSALPEPILSEELFEILWVACGPEADGFLKQGATGGSPSIAANPKSNMRAVSHSNLQSKTHSINRPSFSRTYTSPSESTSILAAQLILHLLPPPHFALLVYLLAFFAQVTLVREENGMGVEDVGKMFGIKLFGHGLGPRSGALGPSKSDSALAGQSTSTSSSTSTQSRGAILTAFFLNHWRSLSDTLFDVLEDANRGLWRRNKLMRMDSLGRDILVSLMVEEAGRAQKDQDDDEEDEEGNNSTVSLMIHPPSPKLPSVKMEPGPGQDLEDQHMKLLRWLPASRTSPTAAEGSEWEEDSDPASLLVRPPSPSPTSILEVDDRNERPLATDYEVRQGRGRTHDFALPSVAADSESDEFEERLRDARTRSAHSSATIPNVPLRELLLVQQNGHLHQQKMASSHAPLPLSKATKIPPQPKILSDNKSSYRANTPTVENLGLPEGPQSSEAQLLRSDALHLPASPEINYTRPLRVRKAHIPSDLDMQVVGVGLPTRVGESLVEKTSGARGSGDPRSQVEQVPLSRFGSLDMIPRNSEMYDGQDEDKYIGHSPRPKGSRSNSLPMSTCATLSRTSSSMSSSLLTAPHRSTLRPRGELAATLSQLLSEVRGDFTHAKEDAKPLSRATGGEGEDGAKVKIDRLGEELKRERERLILSRTFEQLGRGQKTRMDNADNLLADVSASAPVDAVSEAGRGKGLALSTSSPKSTRALEDEVVNLRVRLEAALRARDLALEVVDQARSVLTVSHVNAT